MGDERVGKSESIGGVRSDGGLHGQSDESVWSDVKVGVKTEGAWKKCLGRYAGRCLQ